MAHAEHRRVEWQGALGVSLWVALALAVGTFVATHPGQRTVTPTYRIAAGAWFAGRQLYNDASNIGGFLYFPQSALLYVPFVALPYSVGEVLWRLCGIALFATGLARLARLVSAERVAWLFLLFTLICLPATISSARNGQMNLHLAGLMLHATADVVAGVWWRAALSLTLGLALKPHAIVPMLLIGALYPRTRKWLAAMVLVTAALPFLLQRPSYVVEQYVMCFRRIVFATMPDTDTWSDLNGLLIRIGVAVSNQSLIYLRLAAAVPTLLLAIAARRHGPAWASIFTLALGATYLMLFCPRTEANSYVILAPAVASLAALAAAEGRTIAFWALLAFALGLGVENYGRTIFLMTDLWLKPLLTIVFAVYLMRVVTTGRLASSSVRF